MAIYYRFFIHHRENWSSPAEVQMQDRPVEELCYVEVSVFSPRAVC
jgi:hypothetical protein